MKKKVKALHQVVYGKGQIAMPGSEIELNRANFPGGADEVERLIKLGAIQLPAYEPAEGAPE